MARWLHPSLGLLGRIVAIVLLTILIEFCASTILYDRASRVRVREDEAHRVAEQLAVAAGLLNQRPIEERHLIADRLSSKHFIVRWERSLPAAPRMSAELLAMRTQIEAWEPALSRHSLRLYLKQPGQDGTVTGRLRLDDGSWVTFSAPQLVDERKFRVAWIGMMLVLALALGIMASLLVRSTLRPVRKLSAAAARIGHGPIEPIPEMGTGDIRRLVHAFNDMQARIHSLIEDRVEALAAVGHDLRTPLARLQLRADGIQDGQLRHAIIGDVTEMEAMVASLLAYLGGEDDPEKPVTTDIAVMIATMVDDIHDRGGEAAYRGPEHFEWTARPVAFKRAVRNLVENALKYGQSVQVTFASATGDGLIIYIDDDGPGIPEHRLQDALKPFVRLDAARGRDTKGLGLGLAIAVRAIEREGGSLELGNRPEGGLRATIRLARRA